MISLNLESIFQINSSLYFLVSENDLFIYVIVESKNLHGDCWELIDELSYNVKWGVSMIGLIFYFSLNCISLKRDVLIGNPSIEYW